MSSLLLVEDHVSLARIVADFLHNQQNLEVAAIVHSAESALEQLPCLTIDLVLIDVNLPGMNGIDLVSAIRAQYPALPCLMLSGHKESSYAHQALAAGARGYVGKGDPAALLVAIQCVLDGKIYISKGL